MVIVVSNCAIVRPCLFISRLSASLSFCSNSRSDPRLAPGDARLDDFTPPTSTAVSWTNIAAPQPLPPSLFLFLSSSLNLSLHSLIPSPSD